jgi:predicted nuclease of predicted toxin-antitoxin system
VKFLIDAQLPPALARRLAASGHEAVHVADVDLVNARDREIWKYAAATGSVLVTKDEDFVTMRALGTAGDPAVIWVRIGNMTKRALIGRFVESLPTILAALKRGESVIQISDS